MARALEGLRVLDFTHMLAGPLTTHFARVLGADVIKIETTGRGDPIRYYGPDRRYDGMAPSFIAVNAGKRSLAIDLKAPEAREIMRKLIARADVVIENFRPGVADKLGVGYEAAKALRADIVYCSISAYGQTGPRKFQAGVDNIVQATSGMMMSSGQEGDPPIRVGFPAIDMYAGTIAFIAILQALLRRERFGVGQYLDTAMFDSALMLQAGLVVPGLVTGVPSPRTGNVGFSALPTAGLFETRDGKQISLGVVQQNQFEMLCRGIGREDLLADPRFGQLAVRNLPENHAPLRAIIAAEILKRDGAEWERVLNEHGAPAGVVRDAFEASRDPHLVERGAALPLHVPGLPESEDVTIMGAGFIANEDAPSVNSAPPRLGEHSRAVLAELGYAAAEIDDLAARNVIAAP